MSPSADAGEHLGLFINALGNGLALEKLVDPDAVPDGLFGDLLVLVFQAFEALLRRTRAQPTADSAPKTQKPKACKGAGDG